MKVVSVTVRLVKVSRVSSLDSCASTISNERSGTTIAESNTKVKVKVVSDPTITISVVPLLVIIRDDGGGTTQIH